MEPNPQTASPFGAPRSRADGPLKVTGQAHYSAEIVLPGLLHAVILPSAIANGSVKQIDTADAEAVPGVRAVLTAKNTPRFQPAGVTLSNQGSGVQQNGSAGQQYLPLQDDAVHYAGQHLAVVVAETLEQAQHAATLIHVEYEAGKPHTDLEHEPTFAPKNGWPEPVETTRGDFAKGVKDAEVRVRETYHTALQHHVTMEPHATTAAWDGDHLTLYEPTTFVFGTRKTVATWLQIPEEKIRVLADFVGGSFGCKGPTWPHVALAAVAARQVGRPVRLVLTRPQTFTSNGYRPRIRHDIELGAKRDGTLTAIRHDCRSHTAVFDDRVVAPANKSTPRVYDSEALAISYRMAHLNLCGPFTFRGPGETPGLYALESAMDELAYALKMDPIALRLKNYAERDPENGKPWSSKSLRECYAGGAARFGWDERNPAVRATRDGDWLIGSGMASMIYDAKSAKTSASATMGADGKVVVRSSTCDQGTGSYTIMPQIAADVLGVPVELVRFELGDTDLPQAPISAGSQTTASVGSAVQAAAKSLRTKILRMTFTDAGSPLVGLQEADVRTENGVALAASDPAKRIAYADILRRAGQSEIMAKEEIDPHGAAEKYSLYSFGAHFAEVRVNADTGEVRVSRYVGAFGAGRIVNAKTARSQLIGGVIWGIGQALMEETHLHPEHGRIANADLAEYHVPVNKDIPDMDLFFVEEKDDVVNPLGVKGIGEIGTIGSAAAIANAVYHATGVRVRDLPITPDKLLKGLTV